MTGTIVRPGDIVTLDLPYSEVCMHMQVAGKRLRVRIGSQPHELGSAFIIDPNGREYPPVLLGEVGIHRNNGVLVHATAYCPERP